MEPSQLAPKPSTRCATVFVGLGAAPLPFFQVQLTDGLRLDGLASVCGLAQLTPMSEPAGFLELWTLPLVGTFEPLNVLFSVLRVFGFAPFDSFPPHFKG